MVIISYKEQIVSKMEQQQQKGLEKYGQHLEENDLTIEQKLNHLEEELIDALFYIQHLKGANNE